MLCIMSKDKGLDYLLDLDGEILAQDYGCWVKIEARKLEKATKVYSPLCQIQSYVA